MTTYFSCKDNGSGCIEFYPEPQRVRKAYPAVRKLDPVILGQVRDILLEIKRELPVHFKKQQMQAIMRDPNRLAKLSPGEIEDLFPRY